MLQEIYTFVRSSLANFDSVGAIAPSSQKLATAITDAVAQKQGPASILEVGAGTGVFTKKLVQILGEQDELAICELHPKFMTYLQELAKNHPNFRNFHGKLQFFNTPAQQLEGESRYDFIVSGLPLNAFPPQLVSEILGVLLRLVKPGGWISYFEYIGVRQIKRAYSQGEEKERINEVDRLVTDFIRRYEVYHVPVFWNLPPAYARHCQKHSELD